MRFRQFAVPLQALFALFLCFGMVWMIFVMAGLDPRPPTALDIQLRSTQDLSYVSMNSTAAALAIEMIAEYMPSPIVLMPVTGFTATPSVTITVTAFFTDTPSPTLTFTRTPVFFTLTSTRERNPPTATTVWTSTFPPTSTNTLRPTFTATKPTTPTATETLIPPTTTSLPTVTPTTPPTATALIPPTTVPTETHTPEPPTDTATDKPKKATLEPSETPIP